MKHYFTLALLLPIFLFAQVKIEYGVNISNNFPDELKSQYQLHGTIYPLQGTISLQHEKSELLKSKSELHRLEKFYLSSLNYTLTKPKNLLLEEEHFFDDDYDFVSPKKEYEFTKRGDTLFERGYPILVNDKIYAENDVLSVNEYGDFSVDTDGNEIYTTESYLLNIYDRIMQVKFNETWNIDNKGKFSKTLHYYALVHPFERDGMVLGLNKLPNALNNPLPKVNPKSLFQTFEYDVLFKEIENESVAQELITFPSYYHYLYPLDKLNFLKPLFEGVRAGMIDIYSIDKFDDKGNPIKIIENKLNYLITREMIPEIEMETGDLSIDSDGNEIYVEISSPYTTFDVVGFRFLEDWYLDEKTNTFAKSVKYYAPIFRIMRDGILVGKTPLFWIKN
jgi:hypothetical protein